MFKHVKPNPELREKIIALHLTGASAEQIAKALAISVQKARAHLGHAKRAGQLPSNR